MDCYKMGKTIAKLRKDKKMTQKDLAIALDLSDKTISKWERGLGCPDISVLRELAEILGTNIETILSGETDELKRKKDNIKKIRFYVCPLCSNIITSFDRMSAFCCGKRIETKEPVKAQDEEKMRVTLDGDEYYIESDHLMTKENYITFVAYITANKMLMERTYPEWNLSCRFYNYGMGKLVWADNKGNLFYQIIGK